MSQSHLASILKNTTTEVIRLNFELAYLFQSISFKCGVGRERKREKASESVSVVCAKEPPHILNFSLFNH